MPLEFPCDICKSCVVDVLTIYRKQALRRAQFTYLGAQEGYAVRIPGFSGLLATGRTKRETLLDLASALNDWINLALRRGLGLPAVGKKRTEAVIAR